jgi:site-specific DNA-cytosine methylase
LLACAVSHRAARHRRPKAPAFRRIDRVHGSVPPGRGPDDGAARQRRFRSHLLRLAKGRPAWTIQAQPGPATGPFHWRSRLLAIRELCRLPTLPDDVTIIGSRASAVRQVGNAVPSLLAEVIGRHAAHPGTGKGYRRRGVAAA